YRFLLLRAHQVYKTDQCHVDLPRPLCEATEAKRLHAARHPVHHRTPEDLRRHKDTEGRVSRAAQGSHRITTSDILGASEAGQLVAAGGAGTSDSCLQPVSHTS